MKKLVLIAVMLLVPFTTFALDSMDDTSLDEITAQDGVTIAFDNVEISQGVTDTAWGDGDGYGAGSAANAGFIVMDVTSTTGDVITISDTMDIDVATTNADGATIGTVAIPADTTFVRIGLPSVGVATANKVTEISLSADQNAGANLLGTLYQNTTGETQISGAVFIYAH